MTSVLPRTLDEASLEELIVRQLTAPPVDGGGWISGDPHDYDRAYAIDLAQLTAFIEASQPELAEALDLDQDSPARRKFLARVQGEITKRGIVDVLRGGVKHGPHQLDCYYPRPTPGNEAAAQQFALNRFSVTRQLRYSPQEATRALDLALFVNGLPVATFELKNNITKQTVDDAVQQYKRDRDQREPIFGFGRCLAHFAVDDKHVRFCTHLKGTNSTFFWFDQGVNDGPGNPPNPDGVMTDYLWRRILTPASLAEIIEGFAQILTIKNPRTGKKTRASIFPRYHQLDAVRRLLADVSAHGSGRRYLVEHSTGSGKSNTIAWLTRQLADTRDGGKPIFDSVIVVTDRVILDTQIRDTIKGFTQVSSTVVHAERSGDLRKAIEAGRKVIVTTVQKFPYILDDIGAAHRDNTFAIVIDEAHSSQGGKTTGAMSTALGREGLAEDDETTEDRINQLMAAKKMLPNASYFAFTATPKNKTLETFGTSYTEGGESKHRPFHSYTMKQAIGEGYILDVLARYVPVDSYYRLVKTVEDDPEFDSRRAAKKLRAYVEGHEHAIRTKAQIIVDHFHGQVIAEHKIAGKARAMVVTASIERAIQYYDAICAALRERKSPYRAIVAFSGTHEYAGQQATEAAVNGFPSKDIPDVFVEDPYRILVCADKFQTGYDEPLLHTMYVDKPLSGIKAVQTLSRLNRANPAKHDTAVLDFANDTGTIEKSFEPYYRTTVLTGETDPDKLHDLAAELTRHGVFSADHVEKFAELYLGSAPREQLDPILDGCAAAYVEELDEDDQVAFKSAAKAFTRAYGFLSGILPYSNAEWEKLSMFCENLIPKLPTPREDDLSAGILETIDMESYRVEKRAAISLALADKEGDVEPVPTSAAAGKAEPELEQLSHIVLTFNERFGNIEWSDEDRIRRLIAEDIPRKLSADEAYRNAQANSDRQNARVESDRALAGVMLGLMRDDSELYKQYSDNEDFRRWLADVMFETTYKKSA